MGLTLHYELRLPASTSRADVTTHLHRLRDIAATMPVEHVSRVVDLALGSWEPDSDFAYACIEFVAEGLSDIRLDDGPSCTGDPQSAIGFRVDPGNGAETATFGMIWRRAEDESREEWFWWCSCKTQYASIHGVDHFVKVHTALVAILDAAVELGFEVTVCDEGGYWESRSVDALVAEVTRMNRLMAKFAGALSDAIGDEHDVQAAIFEHRSFEHLEMGQ